MQFVDPATGKDIGTAVMVPVADATVKNLELLVNTLQGNVRMISTTEHDFAMEANSLFLGRV